MVTVIGAWGGTRDRLPQKQIPPLRYGMTNKRTDKGKSKDKCGDSSLRSE